jgi:hypothetical protein
MTASDPEGLGIKITGAFEAFSGSAQAFIDSLHEAYLDSVYAQIASAPAELDDDEVFLDECQRSGDALIRARAIWPYLPLMSPYAAPEELYIDEGFYPCQ